MAIILTVSRKKFSSIGPPQFLVSYAVLVKFAIVEKNSSIFSTLEEPHRPRVPMMRTLSINGVKHHLPK